MNSITDFEKTQRMKELVVLLNQASEAYYNGKEELMSNYEWDTFFDELTILEQELGIILPESPTQNTGYEETKGEKEPIFCVVVVEIRRCNTCFDV